MNKTITLFISFWLTGIVANAQLIDFDTLQTSTVTDIDGNVYKTILFGDTWWMTENLRTKHFNDGSEILQMTKLMDESDDENDWSWWGGVARWGYPNLDSSNFDNYGLLYSWDAVADTKHGGVCPEGWSLTDTADWFNLGRLIVGEDEIVWLEGTRNTPQGGTETYYEVIYIENIGRFLKTDNGVLWTLEPKIARYCNEANMNIYPSGKLHKSIEGFGELAEFWTGCYVHADSSGMGKRYLHFDYGSHTMSVSWNHQANLQCARCVKKATGSGTSGTVQGNASEGMLLYPNPANSYITIRIPCAVKTWSIYNNQGILVSEGKGNFEGLQSIDISSLADGMYIFKTGNFQKTFIKSSH